MREVVNYEHWKSFSHHDEMKKMDSELKLGRNVRSSATKLAKEMINGQFSPLSNNA
jgi:hypothetical protein